MSLFFIALGTPRRFNSICTRGKPLTRTVGHVIAVIVLCALCRTDHVLIQHLQV